MGEVHLSGASGWKKSYNRKPPATAEFFPQAEGRRGIGEKAHAPGHVGGEARFHGDSRRLLSIVRHKERGRVIKTLTDRTVEPKVLKVFGLDAVRQNSGTSTTHQVC